MSWVVTLTLASHPEQEFLLEDDSNLDYSVGPRCPELGNFFIWQSSPISLKQALQQGQCSLVWGQAYLLGTSCSLILALDNVQKQPLCCLRSRQKS